MFNTFAPNTHTVSPMTLNINQILLKTNKGLRTVMHVDVATTSNSGEDLYLPIS